MSEDASADVPKLARHRLPRVVFEQLCAGTIDNESAAAIQAGLHSRRRLLLCALLDTVASVPDIAGPLNDPSDVWHVLAAVDDEHPAVVEEILTHPTVGVWVIRTLAKARGAKPDLIPLWTDLGYFHCLTAAAAIRTGVPCELRLPVTHGVVTLPTVGQVQVPGSFPIGFVELTARAGEVTLTARNMPVIKFAVGKRAGGFIPVHRHRSEASGLVLDIEIDDCDPYREFSAPAAPSRLDEIEAAHWCKQITEAWQILALWHRAHALELNTSLRTLIPIPSVGLTGASSSAAFGAIALGPADTATSLAETLLHEVQHSRLNALFDMLRLHDDDGVARWYAPWRDDPRPLAGVLHGIYAFIAAVVYGMVQRDLVPEMEARAVNLKFALRRCQTREAVTALRATEELTDLGRALVSAVDKRLARTEKVDLPPGLAELVTTITDDHRMIWRLRHIRLRRSDATRLAVSWLDKHPPPPVHDPEATVITSSRAMEPMPRLELLRMQALDPSELVAVPRGCPVGDGALVMGDHIGAKAAYLARIRALPNDVQAWAGLGLVLRSLRTHRAASALKSRPEVVYTVYQELLSMGELPDPVGLATWLGSAPEE